MSDTPDEPIRDLFRRFVGEVRSSPLYQALCPILAGSDAAMALYADTPPTQLRPNLLLAALHASVLRDPAHELAGWFATVGGRRSPDDPALPRATAAFIAERAGELRHGVTHGATQTNEVGRCAMLLATLGELRERGRASRVGLVEIGASAGLNLRLDAYRYEYATASGVARFGDPSRRVVIRCDAGRSPDPLPVWGMEQVASGSVIGSRIGIDLHPLDPTDPDRARWLRALVWPDELERFDRLSAAIALAADHPVAMRTGDAVDDLEAAVGGVPADEHAVVVTTWVLTYLPEARRRAFAVTLDRIGAARDLTWVCIEHPAYAASLPFPPGAADLPLDGGNPVAVHEWSGGRVERHWRATSHPHGTWMRWHPGPTPG